MKSPLVILALFTVNAIAAPAVYTVHCSVFDKQPATKVYVDDDFVVSSNRDVTLYKAGSTKYIVGVSEVRPPSGPITPLIFLTIEKHGKMAAQSMSDFDAQKPGNVNLWQDYQTPGISCRPKGLP